MSKKVNAGHEVERERSSHTTNMDCLKVTNVQVYLLKEAMGKTRAIARVMLNEQMQLTGIRVVDGANGLFVSYPNDPGYKGEDFRSLYYPVTRELREHVEQCVLEEFQSAASAPAGKRPQHQLQGA